MLYLYVYLGIGAFVLLILCVKHWSSIKDDTLTSGLRKSLGDQLIEKVVAPTIAGLAVVVGWPVAIVVVSRKRPAPSAPGQSVPFSPTPKHLTQRLSLAAVEEREIVQDPLGAVPNVPFGHLNRAWVSLVAKAQAGDEVWAFVADWDDDWEGKRELRGYALRRNGITVGHMLTSDKMRD